MSREEAETPSTIEVVMSIKHRGSFMVEGGRDDVVEGVRAFYVGDGFRAATEDDDVLVFERLGSIRGDFGFDPSKSRGEVTVELEEVLDDLGDVGVVVRVMGSTRAMLRFSTRLDELYYRLQTQALERYLRTGVRESAARQMHSVRRPIAIAVLVNIVFAVTVVVVVGGLASFSPPLIALLALVVAFVNTTSIIGFADVVIEGMESLQ